MNKLFLTFLTISLILIPKESLAREGDFKHVIATTGISFVAGHVGNQLGMSKLDAIVFGVVTAFMAGYAKEVLDWPYSDMEDMKYNTLGAALGGIGLVVTIRLD